MRCALAPMRRSFSRSARLGALRLELAHEVLGVDRDRGQRVVELVDDAGGELAERGEPLGAHDLLLQRVDLRLILADRDDRLDRTAGLHRRGRPARSPTRVRTGRPCASAAATVTAAWCWPVSAAANARRELLALIAGDEVADVAAEHLVARVAGELEQRAVAHRDPPRAIDAEDQRVRALEQARLVVAQAERVVGRRIVRSAIARPDASDVTRGLVGGARVVARRIADVEHAVELAAGRERHREAGRHAGERRVPALAHDEPRARGDRALEPRARERAPRASVTRIVARRPSRSGAPRT